MTEQETELFSEEAILLDGLDGAIIGVNTYDGSVVYDEDKVLEILMVRDEMTLDEAYDYYGYNILGLRFDEGTPTFLKKF